MRMRLQIGFLLAIAACLSLTAAETKHEFAIYLTAEPVDRRITAYGTGDWSHVKLDTSPVISATDIVWYAWSGHSIRLRPEALKRIPRPPVEGRPFVVVADGQRIYLGAFTTSLSSFSIAVPSITVDRRSIFTNQPADVLIIERGYPGDSFGRGPDPRPDSRIKDALSALGKLESKE